MNILKEIFSVRSQNNHKVVAVLGVKFKFKRKKNKQQMEKICAPDYPTLEAFRREIFFKNIDIEGKKGMEVGAYSRPTIPEGNVKYVDFYSTEELRKIADPNNINPDTIVQVDYVIKDDHYNEVINEKFDYIIANHVMEHVPNPIQWLKMLEEMLNEDGYLFIVLPDKKYNFDKFRLDTHFTHLLADYYDNTETLTNTDALNASLLYDHNYVNKENDLKAKVTKNFFECAIKNKHAMQHAHVFQAETFVDKILKPILYTEILNLHMEDFAISYHLGEFAFVLQKGFRPIEIDEDKILQIAPDTVAILS